jgi:hypothetical protein
VRLILGVACLGKSSQAMLAASETLYDVLNVCSKAQLAMSVALVGAPFNDGNHMRGVSNRCHVRIAPSAQQKAFVQSLASFGFFIRLHRTSL